MSGTFIAIIILTAILGSYLVDYQKNKLKWQSKNNENDQELNEVREELKRMTKRIENLEAIAAEESFGKNGQNADAYEPVSIEIEDELSLKEQNRRRVANKAKITGD